MYGLQPRVKTEWAPCGRRENVQDYYRVRTGQAVGDYWDARRDPDGKLRDRTTPGERRQYLDDMADVIARVNSWQPQRVLDVGAGMGWLLQSIDCEQRSAVEQSPVALERLELHGVTCYRRLAAVASDSQDVVIAHHVIEHMPDPVCQVNHMRRVLRRGGRLVLGTPDFASPCALRFGERYRMLHDPTHVSLFSLDGLLRMLRDLAWTIEDVQFPFPDRYATSDTMRRWLDKDGISPPWPGNWVLVYASR